MRSHDELDRAVMDHERRLRKVEDGQDQFRRQLDEDKIDRGRMIESIEKMVDSANKVQSDRLEELEKNLKENTTATAQILTSTAKIAGEVEESGKERERRKGADELRKKLDDERKENRERLFKWIGAVVAIATVGATLIKLFFMH